MNARNRDSIAEGAIVALVVIVLGVAASRTNLEPASSTTNAAVDRIAAQVRMQMPIARDCVRDSAGTCASTQVASSARP